MNLPWRDWGVDLVIESTGVFNTDVGASKHLEVGAKKVILTAPGKGEGVGTYVVGVNADKYSHDDFDILRNASCRTLLRIFYALTQISTHCFSQKCSPPSVRSMIFEFEPQHFALKCSCFGPPSCRKTSHRSFG